MPKKLVRTLTLVVAVALAFAPFVWERLLVPSAEAQFQGFTQAAILQNAVGAAVVGANFDTSGAPIVSFQTVMTGVAAVTFQGSLDGTTWTSIGCYAVGSSTIESITGTNPGPILPLVRCNTVGIPLVRANVTTWATGTVTVKAFATPSYFPLGTLTP